jgi:hypothetical protein
LDEGNDAALADPKMRARLADLGGRPLPGIAARRWHINLNSLA